MNLWYLLTIMGEIWYDLKPYYFRWWMIEDILIPEELLQLDKLLNYNWINRGR